MNRLIGSDWHLIHRSTALNSRPSTLSSFPMAKVDLNPSIAALRGKVGRMIYRTQNGQTVTVDSYEHKDRPSPAQKEGRDRFRSALHYAKAVLADPLRRERYRRLGAERKQPVNSLLIANYLNPPIIDRVDLSGYKGRVGSVVRVLATDPIAVACVTVTARDVAGKVLETGPAESDHDVWVYTCTTTLNGVATKFEITAANRAGAKVATTVAL